MRMGTDLIVMLETIIHITKIHSVKIRKFVSFEANMRKRERQGARKYHDKHEEEEKHNKNAKFWSSRESNVMHIKNDYGHLSESSHDDPTPK